MRIIDLTKTKLDEPANQGVFFATKSKVVEADDELGLQKDSSVSKGLNFEAQAAMQSIKDYKKIV